MSKNKPKRLSKATSSTILKINETSLIKSMKIILGVFALFASAQIEIPIKPVPITLQTLAISIIGLTYTPFLSFTTVLTYLLLGASGVPMFIKYGSGVNCLSGMTAGYLIGFLIAAPTISYLIERFSNKFSNIVTCCLIGHVIIYTLGVSWLSTFIGIERAIYSGFLIYIPSGIVKILVLSSLFSYINPQQKQL